MSRYSTLVIAQGATHHWSLDEAGGTAFATVGGVNLNIVNSPARELAVVNNGIVVNTGQYAGATESSILFNNTLPFSYSFIISRRGVGTADAVLARRINSATSRQFAAFFFSTNAVLANALVLDLGANQVRTSTTFLPTIREYYHVAVCWTPTDNTLKLYVNGALYSTHSLPTVPTSNTEESNIRIGTMGGGETTQNFAGLIDEVSIFNGVELTPTMVRAQYATAFPILRVFNGTSWNDTEKKVI